MKHNILDVLWLIWTDVARLLARFDDRTTITFTRYPPPSKEAQNG